MPSDPARNQATEHQAPVPGLPVLALRQNVVFPLTVQPLAINRAVSVESVNRALTGAGLQARVAPLPDDTAGSLEVDAHVRRLQELMDRALTLSTGLSQELRGLV